MGSEHLGIGGLPYIAGISRKIVENCVYTAQGILERISDTTLYARNTRRLKSSPATNRCFVTFLVQSKKVFIDLGKTVVSQFAMFLYSCPDYCSLSVLVPSWGQVIGVVGAPVRSYSFKG